MGKRCKGYNAKVDFEKLVKEIKREFEFRSYKVEISYHEEFSKQHYQIYLKKTNKFRKIVGYSKRIEITIDGKSGYFKVCTIFQDRRKNVLANTAITSPLHVLFFGTSIPFTVFMTIFNELKFVESLWNFIDNVIDDFNR